MTHLPIQKSQKRQFPFITRSLRKLSVVVAYYLDKLSISPLQVLFFRVIFFGGGSLYFFYSDNYLFNLIGLLLVALCYFFDLVDGDLARNHNQVTEVGGFLDGNFDAIVLNSIILTFTLKFYFGAYDNIYVLSGIALLFGTIFSSKMTEIFRNRFDIGCGKGSDVFENYLHHHTFDWVSQFSYGLITPKGLPLSLFSNFRDYLLIGILFGIMPIALVGFAFALNLRWIFLFILLALYYRGISLEKRSLQIFTLMKEADKGGSW